MIKKKIVCSVFLSFTLVLIIGLIRPKPMNSKLSESIFWNNKINDNNKYNFIIIGDSRAYRGVSTNEIEKIIPKSEVKNLGFSSGGFNDDVFGLVDKYIDTTKNNNIVLACLTPYSMTNSAFGGGHLKSLRKKTNYDRWMINNIYEKLRFFDPIIPTELAARFFEMGYFHNYHKSGWVESYKFPIERDMSLDIYKNQFKNNKFENKVFDAFLLNIEKLINKNVKVYVVRMPVYDKLKSVENDFSGFDENYVITKIRESGGSWLNIQDSLYNTYDGSHLDGKSAKLFSFDISTIIKEKLTNE